MASCVVWVRNMDAEETEIDKLEALEMWNWRRKGTINGGAKEMPSENNTRKKKELDRVNVGGDGLLKDVL